MMTAVLVIAVAIGLFVGIGRVMISSVWVREFDGVGEREDYRI